MIRKVTMPNWCENDLYIIGPNRDLIVESVKTQGLEELDPQARVFDFQSIIPRPKILDQTISGSQTKDSLIAGKQAMEETGYSDWYEWNCAKWGTKWNACDSVVHNSPKRLKFSFSTAWGPPTPVMVELSRKFPLNKMKHCFFECGMAYQGRRIYLAGELLETWDGEYHGSRGG